MNPPARFEGLCADYLRDWYDANGSTEALSKLPPPPMIVGANQRASSRIGSLACALVSPRVDEDAAIDGLINWYEEESRVRERRGRWVGGHMHEETMSPARAVWHYTFNAAVLFWCKEFPGAYPELEDACNSWWEVACRLLKLFGTPFGVVSPCAIGTGRDWSRDQLWLYLQGRIPKLPPDNSARDQLVWKLLSECGQMEALRSYTIRAQRTAKGIALIHPITQHYNTVNGSFFAYWDPYQPVRVELATMAAFYNASDLTEEYWGDASFLTDSRWEVWRLWPQSIIGEQATARYVLAETGGSDAT